MAPPDTLKFMLDSYHAVAPTERPEFVGKLVNDALNCTDEAFAQLEDASTHLKTVTEFLKQVEREDGIQVDSSTLERIETAQLRCTSHRISVKQNTLKGMLGSVEYDECFASVKTFTAIEVLQQYLRHGNEVVWYRRQLYIWLNEAMGERLSTRRPGSRNTPSVILSDIRHARVTLESDVESIHPPLSWQYAKQTLSERSAARVAELENVFKQNGMRLNRFGLYCNHLASFVSTTNAIAGTDIPGPYDVMTNEHPVDESREFIPDVSWTITAGDAASMGEHPPEPPMTDGRVNIEFDTDDSDMNIDAQSCASSDDDSLRSSTASMPTTLPSQESTPEIRGEDIEEASCRCTPSVPRFLIKWAEQAVGKDSPVGRGMNRYKCTLNDDTIAVLGLYVALPAMQPSGEHAVCHLHRRRMMKMVSLANSLSTIEADKRIRSLWDGRADLKAWRQSHDSWLTRHELMGDNPDYVSLYRFPTRQLSKPVLIKMRMLEQLFGPQRSVLVEDLHVKGNAVYDSGFDWLLEGKSNLIQLMREEMDVMLYHTYTRSRNDKSYKGWSNASHHMLCQQLTRQDLWFWAATSTLRDDSTYELVTIPAQAKHAVKDDNTGFYHVDFNIQRLRDRDLVSRGKVGQYRLQAALSLDDEDNNNCTVVIDGLHRDNYKDAWKIHRIARKFGTGSVVNLKAIPSSEIRRAIGRTYRPIPVRAGGVRFMNAATFHGSTKTATKTRRVLFPWYTRVDSHVEDDGGVSRSFETDALDSVENYVVPATTLTFLPTTGGGQFPRKSRVPFRFPPHSCLLPSCLISSALIGTATWDQPAVTAEVREFFRNPYVSIRRQRREMARALRWHMHVFRQAEREAFGENSYYVHHPERAVVPEIKDDWVDAMDEIYEHHACVRDFASGSGTYRECLGDACIAEGPSPAPRGVRRQR